MSQNQQPNIQKIRSFVDQLDVESKKVLFGLLFWELQTQASEQQANLVLSDGWPLLSWQTEAILLARQQAIESPDSVMDQTAFDGKMKQFQQKFDLQ